MITGKECSLKSEDEGIDAMEYIPYKRSSSLTSYTHVIYYL